MRGPMRLPREPRSRAYSQSAPMLATIAASWIETSINCGRPDARPVSAAIAASGPTCE